MAVWVVECSEGVDNHIDRSIIEIPEQENNNLKEGG